MLQLEGPHRARILYILQERKKVFDIVYLSHSHHKHVWLIDLNQTVIVHRNVVVVISVGISSLLRYCCPIIKKHIF